MSDAHQRLRADTRQWHRGVESLPLFKKLLCAHITVEDLRNTLTVLYQFYAQIEPSLQAHFPEQSALPYQAKTAALAADLAILGASLPPLATSLAISDRAMAWGARYVLEGAVLGGNLIARQLEKNLPLTAGTLSFYRENPAIEPGWTATMAHLASELQTPEQLSHASTTACDLFALLYNLASNYPDHSAAQRA